MILLYSLNLRAKSIVGYIEFERRTESMFEDTRMRQKLAKSYRGELNTTWFVRRLCRDCACWQMLLFGVNAVTDEVNKWPFTMKYWMELIIKMKKLKPSNRLEMSGSSAGVSDHPDPYLLPSWGSEIWDRIIRDHSWELRGTTSYNVRIFFILEALEVTKFILKYNVRGFIPASPGLSMVSAQNVFSVLNCCGKLPAQQFCLNDFSSAISLSRMTKQWAIHYKRRIILCVYKHESRWLYVCFTSSQTSSAAIIMLIESKQIKFKI